MTAPPGPQSLQQNLKPDPLYTFLLIIIPVLPPLVSFPLMLHHVWSLAFLTWLAGHPLHVPPWTSWACPVPFMLLPHGAQHSVGQGHCVQLCGVGHLQRDMSRGRVSAHLHSPKHAASGAVCYRLEGTRAPFPNLYKGTCHVC